MSKKSIPCRACQKLFAPCKNCDDRKTFQHWRDICCSPECFVTYVYQVTEGRGKTAENDEVAEKPVKATEKPAQRAKNQTKAADGEAGAKKPVQRRSTKKGTRTPDAVKTDSDNNDS